MKRLSAKRINMRHRGLRIILGGLLVVGQASLAALPSDDEASTASLAMPGLSVPSLPPTPRIETPTTRPSPATAPATQAVESSRPYPDEYTVLIRRSIFARGGQPAAARAAAAAAGGPEGTLGLKGIFGGDGQFTAFVEDLPGKKTIILRIGDAIGMGHIRAMTLASIEYEARGQTRKILVGQNLLGAALPPPAPATQPAQGPPGAPPPGAGPPPPGGMPPGMTPQQMEQMMRARQMGH